MKDALSYLNPVDSNFKINFSIIGPIGEPSYWKECEVLIKKMPKHIRIKYLGAILNLKLPEVLEKLHVLLLPTFHENFGHVIVEAFQNGCPVILSDLTPWNALEKKGIGFDIPLNTPKNFLQAIENFASMDQSTFNKKSDSTFKFAKENNNTKESIEAYRVLFT